MHTMTHTTTTHAQPVRRYTLTASLVAARLEEDDAIQLDIANPADPAVTVRVSFPAVAAGAGALSGVRGPAAGAARV